MMNPRPSQMRVSRHFLLPVNGCEEKSLVFLERFIARVVIAFTFHRRLTMREERGIGEWLSTILEPVDKDFAGFASVSTMPT